MPALGFGIAAATGNTVLPSDDLTQNLPLRVLAGHDLEAGHLPLWDPYIWSGTALLGGFNAGALYPFTLLFAVLSPTVAWSIGESAVYAVSAAGLYVFLRAEARSWVAALVGATSFGFAGAMLGQLPHIGLVEGLSWLPWILLCLRGLGRARGTAVCGWVAALGALGGLVILAGEPRATSDVTVVAMVYGLGLLLRHRDRAGPLLAAIAGAVLLALMLGSAQLLPGLDFLDISQRAHTGYSFFSVGSLPWSALILLAAPYALGGYGNLGVAYAGPYNLAEVTTYVGLLPLAAALALLPWPRLARPRLARPRLARPRLARPRLARLRVARLRVARLRVARRYKLANLRRSAASSPPGAGPGTWWALVVVGLLLSVAGSTPLGPLLSHLPLYGRERLQNRNAVELDLGLAVLFAIWVDRVLGTQEVPWARLARRASCGLLALLGVGSWLVAAWGLGLGPGLGALAAWRPLIGGVAPLLAASGALGLGGAWVVGWLMAGTGHQPGHQSLGGRQHLRAGALVALTFLDVALFVVNGNWSAPEGSTIASTNPTTTALSRLLGPQGRFAVYDPEVLSPAIHTPDGDALGVADLNILHDISSIQGYGSIQSGSYEEVTDTHARGSLALSALTPAVGNQLDLRVLLTLPRYLVSPARTSPAPTGPTTTIPAGGSGSWWFGSVDQVTQVRLVFGTPPAGPAPRVKLEMLHTHGVGASPSTGESWEPQTGSLILTLHDGSPAVGISIENPSEAPLVLEPPVVTPRGGAQVSLSGPLQGHLATNGWRWAGTVGGFAAFQSLTPSEPYSVAAVSGGPVPQVTILPEAVKDSVRVTATTPALLVRSVAYAPGWQAELTPTGPTRSAVRISQVSAHGLVQAAEIPPGSWSVTWRYRPPGLELGLELEAAGALLFLILVGLAVGRGPARRSI